jgi:hypothetical protein
MRLGLTGEENMRRHVAQIVMAAGVASLCLTPCSVSARAPTDVEAQSIVTLCGGGVDTSVRAGLLAKLKVWAKSLQGSAEVGAEAGKRTLGALFADLPSGQQINSSLYTTFINCVLKATDTILREPSVNALTQIQVDAEMLSTSGRSSDPVHHTFKKTYSRGQESLAGRDIAVEMIEHLERVPHSPALKVTLINQGGKLSVQDPGGFASLHVSRFIHFRTLADLVKQPLDSIEEFANPSPTQVFLAQKDVQGVNLDRITRAGVYRIAVTSPFYQEHVIYCQLSARGDLYVPLQDWLFRERDLNALLGSLQPLALPHQLTLTRSSGNLAIAMDVEMVAPNFPNASFPSETRNLEKGFVGAVGGYAGYEYVERGSAVYDSGREKGLPSRYEPADVQVDVHAIVVPGS